MNSISLFAWGNRIVKGEEVSIIVDDLTKVTANTHRVLTDLDLGTASVTIAAAMGSTPNNAGLSAVTVSHATTLTTQPADTTHPGLWSTSTQTLPGNKTFTGSNTFSAGNLFTSDVDMSGINVLLPNIGAVDSSTLTSASLLGSLTNQGNATMINWAACNGIAPTTGQTCSLTPTQIGFGSMTPANHQGFTLASNKFTFAKAGTYRFQVKLQFSAGPTEYAIKMRQGASGGALSDTSQDGKISNSTATGSPIVIATFQLDAQSNTPTDVDFTIAAQSYPAATFPTINSSGSFNYQYIGKMDIQPNIS
jgi:hypothetical protein